ncbi:hypothetical protein LTR84_013084 [Exophiala bonariae]|uniref:Anaphase-promoting complex subunit 4 n=1 Tax=Exophiala bonariae TaxID=1690606 RepID=A0AAV9NDS1_9EURO|nr:hypothetical protein LTR84_013084 [Exophiala bonariae]
MHQIATRILTEPCIPTLTDSGPNLFAYCPTMDLVATVSQPGVRGKAAVDVWRLNGQNVFGANFDHDSESEDEGDGEDDGGGQVEKRGEGTGQDDEVLRRRKVRGLCWRRDGQVLAVACFDSSVALINAFTGKIAHHLHTNLPPGVPISTSPSSSFTSSPSRSQKRRSRTSKGVGSNEAEPESTATVKTRTNVSCISWTTHFATPSPLLIRKSLEVGRDTEKAVTLDQILGLKADIDRLLSLKADLPGELSAIDIEASLPKLATLPPIGVGSGDDVFSSRGSLDAIFHAANTGLNGAVDVLIVGLQEHEGTGRCAVHLEIFDSFTIGAVDVGSCFPTSGRGAKVRAITSHPYLSLAFLLLEQPDFSLHVACLDMSFIPQTGRNLPLVARKVTQLGNLLRYVSQVQMQLSAEIKAAFDLPSRFLRNINESLAEADPDADFSFAAHHLAVTGDCDPRVREWLVDEVGNRGLKRWEKAVGDCLDVVRRMTSECLQPALERMQVILSRLDGLAKFSGTRERLGLNEQAIRRVRETVDVLGLVAEDMLIDVGVEIREFGSFMRWLTWECEVEALEEGSERAEELRESWTGEQELRAVLDYVGGAMNQSRLKRYIDAGNPGGEDAATKKSFDEETDTGFYADFTERRRRRTGSNTDYRSPTLRELLERLRKQCDVVFGQIAETFRKSLLTSYLFSVPGQYDGNMLDVRVMPDQIREDTYSLVILAKDHRGQLQLTVADIQMQTGKRIKMAITSNTALTIAQVTEILDAKIVDDEFVMVLAASTEGDARLYTRAISTEAEQNEWELRHVFDDGKMDAGMKPARLEANGRAGRRVVAVVDQAGLGFVVFDLDTGLDVDGKQGTEDEVMTG